jgi:hypothetical protein
VVFSGLASYSVRSYFVKTYAFMSNHMTYSIRILLGALVATIVADGIITQYLIAMGFAHEGNPFLHFWIQEDTFLIVKLLGGLLAAIYLWNIYRRHSKLAIVCSSMFLTLYTFIIFWNLRILIG